MEAVRTLVEDARGEIGSDEHSSGSRHFSDSSASVDVAGEETSADEGRNIMHTDNPIYGSREASVLSYAQPAFSTPPVETAWLCQTYTLEIPPSVACREILLLRTV